MPSAPAINCWYFQGFAVRSVCSTISWVGILPVGFPRIGNSRVLDLIGMMAAQKFSGPKVGRLTYPGKGTMLFSHGGWQGQNSSRRVAVQASGMHPYCLSSRR